MVDCCGDLVDGCLCAGGRRFVSVEGRFEVHDYISQRHGRALRSALQPKYQCFPGMTQMHFEQIYEQ